MYHVLKISELFIIIFTFIWELMLNKLKVTESFDIYILK